MLVRGYSVGCRGSLGRDSGFRETRRFDRSLWRQGSFQTFYVACWRDELACRSHVGSPLELVARFGCEKVGVQASRVLLLVQGQVRRCAGCSTGTVFRWLASASTSLELVSCWWARLALHLVVLVTVLGVLVARFIEETRSVMSWSIYVE